MGPDEASRIARAEERAREQARREMKNDSELEEHKRHLRDLDHTVDRNMQRVGRLEDKVDEIDRKLERITLAEELKAQSEEKRAFEAEMSRKALEHATDQQISKKQFRITTGIAVVSILIVDIVERSHLFH